MYIYIDSYIYIYIYRYNTHIYINAYPAKIRMFFPHRVGFRRILGRGSFTLTSGHAAQVSQCFRHEN